MDEEGVLKWVTTTKEQDVDVIEEVDVATLEKMLDDHVNVVVYFCKLTINFIVWFVFPRIISLNNPIRC